MMPNVNRDEHLKWAKERALEYLDHREYNNAVTSMLSDLSKHPELKGIGEKMAMLGIWILTHKAKDPNEIRRFIEGFN